MTTNRTAAGLCLVVLGLLVPDRLCAARAADQAVVVEPSELARRPELVGREVIVDDRVKYFLESRKGQGYDQLILKRTDVPFFLPVGLRRARSPSEPNALVRGVLKVVDGRLVGEAITLELLPADVDRFDRELGRLRVDDFAARRVWALWAERRGRELNDPKLAARGVAAEIDALWTEANRPGADALALAAGAADRPIPLELRNALYYRGFRQAAAQAQTPDDLAALAERVAVALPGATTPTPGAGPGDEAADPEPATAYRAAPTEDARQRLDRRLYADLLARSLDLRLMADPTRAASLADEAARTLPDRPTVADNLRRRGLAETEKGVTTLRQPEVEQLARTLREAGQEERAQRALEAWLTDRRQNRLSDSDAEGRVLLAANYEKLLGDRTTAGLLLNEALAIEPESRVVADAFLRLGYRKGDRGWYDPAAKPNAEAPTAPAVGAAGRSGDREDSLRGLTQAQARSRMGGKPDRVVRVATQAMIVEQWIYRIGKTEQVIIFRIEPANTEPRVATSYAISK